MRDSDKIDRVTHTLYYYELFDEDAQAKFQEKLSHKVFIGGGESNFSQRRYYWRVLAGNNM